MSIKNKKNTSIEEMVDEGFDNLECELEKKDKKRSNAYFFAIVIVLLALCTVLAYLILTIPGKIAKENYVDAAEEAYTNIYDTSRAAAEEKWHVSNEVDIQMGEIKQNSELHVLKVYDVEYIMNSEEIDGIFSCLEVTGSGTYKVDLMASEFVVDNKRSYVLARIPNPILEDCTIENCNILVFKDGILNGNSGKGVQLAEEDCYEAAKKIEETLNGNVEYYEKAKKAAITEVENLVRQLNPSVKALNVEVEFFE